MFGIEGVTEKLVEKVIGSRSFELIGSTITMIAAACVTEAMKILSGHNFRIKNHFHWNGVQTHIHSHHKNPFCLICKPLKVKYVASRYDQLQDFMKEKAIKGNLVDPKFKIDPSIE
jgi:hypothetical protein